MIHDLDLHINKRRYKSSCPVILNFVKFCNFYFNLKPKQINLQTTFFIKACRTSLGTSVSNPDFDLGYTGMKAEDCSLLEGGHSCFDLDF